MRHMQGSKRAIPRSFCRGAVFLGNELVYSVMRKILAQTAGDLKHAR